MLEGMALLIESMSAKEAGLEIDMNLGILVGRNYFEASGC